MALPAGVQPVRADEVLYRRVPEKRYDRATGFALDAFLPIATDTDGLSFSRNCMTPEQVAATGTVGKQFWVAALNAAHFTAAEMTIAADAVDHAVIPEMRRGIYETPEGKPVVQGLARQLSALVIEVYGPFPGQRERG